jgi:hypothetical protein
LKQGQFGNEFGVMTIIEVDNVGDSWCMNDLIKLEYPHNGICQSTKKLSLVTPLMEVLA